MISPADLPDVVPLFPLPGAMLLPRARLPLNVFEPRYLAMVDDTLKTRHRLIAMIQPIHGQGNKLHNIGCAGRITSFTETDDNRYMITLTGVSRFQLNRVEEGFTPYTRARVDWSGFSRDCGRSGGDPEFDRDGFFALLRRYFTSRELSTNWDQMKSADEEMLVNSLSMLCPFPVEDKQALLEAPSLAERRAILTTLIEYALLSGQQDEVMQ